jgi:hypothetical protein
MVFWLVFSRTIEFRDGYRYQLKRAYSVNTPLRPPADVVSEFVVLEAAGDLHVRSGYAWDGPSGPTFDTLSFMRGSLVHDALYQLIREGHLPRDPFREHADRLLREHCREDGMSALRAWYVYQAVRLRGDDSLNAADRPLRVAP